ncbi:hypothetical protein [Nocardioides sp. S5]|uniref:hypothetical protein n=1 Tax=Nocardioides sp. S5 TaxID=2017486 RepID=UPI001A8CA420|nr:hypothetical protein [Nocardioides sp. S5]
MGVKALAGDLKAELIEPAKLGQIRASEGSVRQVEVFQMASVRTSIIGRPRRLPGHRPYLSRYTVICDEPPKRADVTTSDDPSPIFIRRGGGANRRE